MSFLNRLRSANLKFALAAITMHGFIPATEIIRWLLSNTDNPQNLRFGTGETIEYFYQICFNETSSGLEPTPLVNLVSK